MKFTLVIACLSLLFLAGMSSKIELERRTLLNGKIEILLPTDFEVMSEELMVLKYPSERRPTLVYSDETGGVNVAFNHTADRLTASGIEGFKAYVVGMFQKMYPAAHWIGSGIKAVNGKKVGYLELITPAIDTKIYNLIYFADLEERLLLCTFNCVVKRQKTWIKPAHEMLNSLTIK